MTTGINYAQMKNMYYAFRENPPTDSFTRYYKELNFMRNLIKFAKSKGLEKDVFEYEKIKEEAVTKLKEMGFKFSQ